MNYKGRYNLFKRFLKSLLIVVLVTGVGFTSGYYSNAVLKKIIPAEKFSGINKYLASLKPGKAAQPEAQQENADLGTAATPGAGGSGAAGDPGGIAANSTAINENAPELQASDRTLGGLKTGDKRQTVEEVMGKSVKVLKSYDKAAGQNVRTFEKDGLSVAWGKKTGVFSITVTSPGSTTARGLQVGDAMQKAYQLYGRPASELDGVAAYKNPESGAEEFFIKYSENKVVEIKIATSKL